jgi:glycogen synthase
MRVLMFGWEFPPFISGGLGTACFGMTQALASQGVEIVFVLPRIKGEERESHVKLISASEVPVSLKPLPAEDSFGGVEFRQVDSVLKPYLTPQEYQSVLSDIRADIREQTAEEPDEPSKTGYLHLTGEYGTDLIREAFRYAQISAQLAREEKFDVIHAHDWMTFFAGVQAKRISGKPLVLHIHALEFDRSGENINRNVYDIEHFGMEFADHVIAVSHYTKNTIVNRYGIRPEKITVVHNAVDRENGPLPGFPAKRNGQKIVLFLGRITFQKGPEYFIEAAALVLKHMPNVTFIMAGAGDMRAVMIERVAQLGIGRNFHFLGFVSGLQIEQVYAMSDLYVMPSVSEPFGISPLEAMLRDVPVIISKQSGVSEVLRNALKVDFWDVRELANKIISVLKYPALSKEMVIRSRESLNAIHWEDAAKKLMAVYRSLVQ